MLLFAIVLVKQWKIEGKILWETPRKVHSNFNISFDPRKKHIITLSNTYWWKLQKNIYLVYLIPKLIFWYKGY